MIDENGDIYEPDIIGQQITELQSAVVALQGQIADIMEILTELVNKL